MKRKLISLMLCLCMVLSFEGIALATETEEPECEIAEVEIDGNVYYLTCETKVAVKQGETFETTRFKVTNDAGNRYPELEKKVAVTGEANTKKVGNYQIEYELEGVSVTQNVEVVRQIASANPEQEKKEEGKLQLVVVGKEVTNATLGEQFHDYGAHLVTSDGEVRKDLDTEITVSGKVDTSEAGIYILTYTYKDMTAERIVNMCRVKALLDGQYLYLELNGLSEMEVQKGEKFVDPGFKVTNILGNVYSKLDSKVTVSGKVNTDKVGDYIITYKFGDATITRLVHVKETVEAREDEPEKADDKDISYRIKPAGKKTMTVKKGETFQDLGVWVVDEDGNIYPDMLGEVIVEGQVNTGRVGKYTLTYKFEKLTFKRVVYVVSESGEDLDTGSSQSSIGAGDSGNTTNPDPENPGKPDQPDPDNPDKPDKPDPDNPDKPVNPKPDDPKPDDKPTVPDKPKPPTPSGGGPTGPSGGSEQLPGDEGTGDNTGGNTGDGGEETEDPTTPETPPTPVTPPTPGTPSGGGPTGSGDGVEQL